MDEKDLIQKIEEDYESYTKAEKKVANFVLDDPKRILFMSISELAEACKVGDTTVFRFCRSLKLQGYQEFKMKLSFSINRTIADKGEELGAISMNDSFEMLSQKVLQNNLNAINETYSLIKADQFERGMIYLEEARSIHFFGVGASMLTAMMGMNKFLKITPNVSCLMDAHMQAMAASMLGPQDVAVIISHSGATKDTIHVAKVAKSQGAKIICITRYQKSPLSTYSDVTILCGANEGPLEGSSTSSSMSQMLLIDLMYMEFYRRKLENTSRNIEKTAASVLDKIY